jgi:hypothetical protein
MWLVKYYPLIHKVALYLSLAVIGVIISFVLIALITRFWLDRRDQKQKEIQAEWLERFQNCANGILSDENTVESLKSLYYRTQHIVFQAWLKVFENASENEVNNLRNCARDLNFPDVALRHLRKGSVQDQITACNIFGRLRSTKAEEILIKLLESNNNYLKVPALEALIRIDIDEYFDLLIKHIINNPDANFHFATRPLVRLQDIDYSKKLVRSIKDHPVEDREWALRLLEFADCNDHREYTLNLLKSKDNPEVLSSLLRLVRFCEFTDAHDRVIELLKYDVWFVQLQAAITLRFIGGSEDIDSLEPLLGHREWWVRYRTAQTIQTLADVGSKRLETLLENVKDRYAKDILKQVQSE